MVCVCLSVGAVLVVLSLYTYISICVCVCVCVRVRVCVLYFCLSAAVLKLKYCPLYRCLLSDWHHHMNTISAILSFTFPSSFFSSLLSFPSHPLRLIQLPFPLRGNSIPMQTSPLLQASSVAAPAA